MSGAPPGLDLPHRRSSMSWASDAEKKGLQYSYLAATFISKPQDARAEYIRENNTRADCRCGAVMWAASTQPTPR